jgi:hypothetical protein
MNSNLERYKYLWDGSSEAWALMQSTRHEPNAPPSYSIVNTETRRALLISDNALFAQVIQEMLSHGVRIVSVGNGF